MTQMHRLGSKMKWRLFLVISIIALLSSLFYVRRAPKIVCSNIGDRNFVPQWTRNTNGTSSRDAQVYTKRTPGGNEEYLVPNIVHYIWYYSEPKQFKFHHMLSVLSVQKNIKPDVIYFHTNRAPTGHYWDEVKDIPIITMVHRQPSQCLFDEVIKEPYYETSESNVDRLRVLHETGGIYLDLDVIAIQSFDELRKYPCTVGLETDDLVCGGIIICRKDSPFLAMWLNSFLDDYRVKTWAYNTGRVPTKLLKRYPHLVHVERDKLNRPSGFHLNQILGSELIPWKAKYSIHLWYRQWKKSGLFTDEPNLQNIKTWNSTFGQMSRSVLYGTDKIM